MTELKQMPGTISDAAKQLRWMRTRDWSDDCRKYEAATPDGLLKALVSHDEIKPGVFLWHISISHSDKEGKPDRVPTWDEMKHAKYQLVDADVVMVLIFPRRSARYVNLHDTCLHLWEAEPNLDE